MGNHRADRRGPKRVAVHSTPISPAASQDAGPAGGRRKATTRTARPNPFVKVPAAPTLIGAVAMLTAAGGAIGLGQGLPGGNIELSAGNASFTGTDTISWASRDPRAQAISRDSQRQALKDAAEADLQRIAEAQSQQRNATLASQAKKAEQRADEIAKNLWIAPLSGYRLTARFGAVGLWSSTHTGLDFAGPYGSALYAVGNGVITDTGYDGSYGNKTVLTLTDGTEIWYCHQSAIGVNVGDAITQGEQIGNLGSTGNSTGPHLHIEVRPGGGDPVDPYFAFLQHGLQP